MHRIQDGFDEMSLGRLGREMVSLPTGQGRPRGAGRGRFSLRSMSMKRADRHVHHQAKDDEDGNDDWRNEPALAHALAPSGLFCGSANAAPVR